MSTNRNQRQGASRVWESHSFGKVIRLNVALPGENKVVLAFVDFDAAKKNLSVKE